MSGPFIFIATNRLRDGKFAAERERAVDLSSLSRRTSRSYSRSTEYADEEGTEVGVVQLHLDAA